MEPTSSYTEQCKKPTYKYCIVPMCRNTIRNAPDKVFFFVPRGADIRRKWCEIMKRDMVSPSTCLYCCEDHFDIEEDTDNYMKYKILNLQEKRKITLRLKKGILPHKFQCQNDTESQPPPEPVRKGFLKRKHLEIIESSTSAPPAKQSVSVSDSSSENYLEAGTSSSASHVYIEDTENKNTCEAGTSSSSSHIYKEDTKNKNACEAGTSSSASHVYIEDTENKNACEAGTSSSSSHIYKEDTKNKNACEAGTSSSSSHIYKEDTKNKNACEAGCSTSLSIVYSEKKMYVDKAIQVNSKIYYRSKSVNVNLCPKTKSTAVSPFPVSSKTTSTSPLKLAQAPGVKRKLFHDNPDLASMSSAQPSVLSSSSFEPDTSSPESSWIIEDDSEKEKLFKNQMRCCMLTAIEKEPKMLLGLPKRSYFLIKLLSENIPLPIIDILITLKKIKLNESFSILALQFGYTQSTISRIFSKSVPLLAGKMKNLIVWPTSVQIFNNLPISFRARYSNVVSIIDCLEIQIEKPSNAVHQSLTWSQYKKCNTLKYLISCTPTGLVNFISEGYSGRATDVMIVEDCGFLECLPSKTAVMADRGFKDLSYLLGKKDCTLIRPPSVSKSTPSSKEDVKLSKRIAALRIHVERVINRLREFNMLLPHACVDHNLIPIIDEVIIVACGLINMQNVLIKK